MAVGRVSMRSADDAWSARIQWHQAGRAFRIRLSGPLGQGVMELASAADGGVELRTGEGVYRADSAEALLLERTGWTLPLEGLRYWILGGAEPGAAVSELDLDALGRPRRLEQSGWRIEYQRFAEIDGVTLPVRLDLHHPRFRARLLVSRWDL